MREGFGQEHFPAPLSAFESGFGQAFRLRRRASGRTTLPRSRACWHGARSGFRIGIRSRINPCWDFARPRLGPVGPAPFEPLPFCHSKSAPFRGVSAKLLRALALLRRGRDSNPRYGYYPVWGISNPLLSAAQPPLLLFQFPAPGISPRAKRPLLACLIYTKKRSDAPYRKARPRVSGGRASSIP